MSQSVPPQLEGHIESPNPLELFWEKNKRAIQIGAVVVAIALAINYGIQYMNQRKVDASWSELMRSAGLDLAYADSSSSLADYFMKTDEHLEAADTEALTTLAAGTDARAPLALWVLANHAVVTDSWGDAEQRLKDLESRFPEHFLCQLSPYPAQWRPEVPPDEDAPEDEPKPEEPELEPPAEGSAVGILRKSIESRRAFREQNRRMFEPTEPDSAETVEFEFRDVGVVKVRLFAGVAPKHVEKFLELARQDGGWWTGQRVHEVERQDDDTGFRLRMFSPSAMHIGWPSTKNDDRAEWKAEDVDEEHVVDAWEVGALSHFPGTLAVEPDKEGKSQVERLVFNFEDVGALEDGGRVIIGRVVDGLDVIQQIIEGGFDDDEAAKLGRGRPAENYTVTAVRVVE